ncbi:beta-ketoacyl synthase N-terminal-like domain-containing protein [Saccharomonospora azurea]
MESLERYGLDSLLVIGLTRRLEEHLGRLPKTLFFEYLTIRELAAHLAQRYPRELAAALGDPAEDEAASEERRTEIPEVPATVPVESGDDRRDERRTALPAATATVSVRADVPAHERRDEDIAIIGVAGRYPKADDLRRFWRNLAEGRDCIEEVPADRWDHSRYFDPEKGALGKAYSKWGGFLSDVDKFDPMLFRMSKIEAEHLDPQERLFLQTVWEVLEDAGYTRRSLAGATTGVFVGMMYGHYQLHGVAETLDGTGVAPSSSYASVANRASYFFGFTGPSIALDTMCSSSLVTIHLGVQAIRNGDCDLAVAGGVNVSSHPLKYLQLSQRGFLSTDGRCRSFGEGGDGYVPGEGSGAVLLKRLSAAERDGDRILAVVKASAVNHGGASKGYSVPNPRSQGEVIGEALRRSGVDPRAITYVEAHGTGTALGDPVEISGLARAFADVGDPSTRRAVGSVKSNIGHAESAAGIAAVTKVLLQLRHRQLVPSLHADPANPNIDFEATPFEVQRTLAPWPAAVDRSGREMPRAAGVSSFGAGGSNAHLVLEEYVGTPRTAVVRPERLLFVLSARDAERLRAYVERMEEFLGDTDVDPVRLARTLQVGREAMRHRLAIPFRDRSDLLDALRSFRAGEPASTAVTGTAGRPDAGTPLDPVGVPLEELARHWLDGGEVDWDRLYRRSDDDPLPAPESLPTYPFARQRCWLDVPLPHAAPQLPPQASTPSRFRVLAKQWSVEPWQDGELPGRVAILADDRTAGLATLLRAHLPGSVVFRLPTPDSPPAGDTFAAVVDLIGEDRRTRQDLARWLPWVQDLLTRSPQLLALGVTWGLEQPEGASGASARTGGSEAALYRSLQGEYRRLRSRHVDLEPGLDDDSAVRVVLAELADPGSLGEVSHRRGVRFAATLTDVAAAEPTEPVQWNPDEVLWVTGGTRGLGLLAARHLVRRHGVRRVVVTGRQPLPPPDRWEELAQGTDAPAAKVRGLLDLAAQGVEVRALSVPLSDPAAVVAAVREVEDELGPIAGLLHCAGTVDRNNPAFVRKSVEDVRAVLRPKVEGLDALLSAVEGRALRFAVLFSSVASAVPTLAAGQLDYAMANAHLDYAAQSRAHAVPLVSVQWPSWKDTGMGEVRGAAFRSTGMAALTDDDGLALLDTVLDGRHGRVVLPAVVDDDSAWRPGELLRRTAAAVSAEPTNPTANPEPSRSPSPAPTGVPERVRVALSDWMVELFADELHFEAHELDAEVPIEDYGLDSIMVTQLLGTVARRLDTELDPSALLEHSSIDRFTAWLVQEHPTAVLAAFDGEPDDAGDTEDTDDAAATETVAAARTTPTVSARVLSEPAPATVDDASSGLDIAVVGMACRLPGASDIEEYWRLLSDGRSAIGTVPESRGDMWGPGHPAAFIDGYREFDPEFFLLSSADAEAMDPQAMLLLELSLELLAHAGYQHTDLKGSRTGVYVGGRAHHVPDEEVLRRTRNPIVAVGQNYLAANVSHFFDLRGPSVVVDTACSSALVALSMAVDALRAGTVEAAVVGGVSLHNTDHAYRVFGRRGLLGAGDFHVFDRRADGVVLGEGAGLVLVKPLERALADSDRVYAVLRGLAVNNDGRTAGPATPNIAAQRQVLEEGLRASGKRADDIGYIEANGSGSVVTDLLELKAVSSVYRADSAEPCGLGSIKPNIGHPLCAEGIAGLLKVVLMLHHGRVVPFLSGQEPPEHFDLAGSPFRFDREARDWPGTRCAALNCFADGGTNAHAVLEAWQDRRPDDAVRTPVAVPALDRRYIGARPAPNPDTRGYDDRPEAVEQMAQTGLRQRVTLTPEHPLVAGHRMRGERLLPAMAYLDLAFRLFADRGYEPEDWELRDLTILRPLAVADEPVDVAIVATGSPSDGWHVEVADERRPGRVYATVEVVRAEEPVPSGSIVPPTGAPDFTLDEAYAAHAAHGLTHAGVIRAEGRVYRDRTHLIATVELGEEAKADAYLFHPALLDGVAIAAGPLFRDAARLHGGFFLPIHLASFRSVGPLPSRCHARVRLDTVGRRHELVHLTIELFDDEGRQLAVLDRLSSKLVRPEVPATSATPAPRSTGPAAPAAGEAEAVLRDLVASRLGVPRDEIDAGVGYYELGLQSLQVLELVSELERAVGAPLPPTLPFEYATIRDLARHLTETYPAAFGGDPARPTTRVVERTAPVGRVEPPTPSPRDDGAVAVIGLSGRYPGAGDVEAFWRVLREGRNTISEVPRDRWSVDEFADVRGPSGRGISKWGGFLENVDCFDAALFRISPREAEGMDPQERLFLETCWTAVEDAGYTPATLCPPTGPDGRKHVGVFAGVMQHDYLLLGADAIADGAHVPLVLNQGQIANRVSFFCDFHGPSITTDTLCSSALTSVHLAVQSLRTGESRVAIAGGVNLSLHPGKYLTYGMANMHSSDGVCHSFGAGGDGYVSAEGVGAVVLKPLADALRDGDHVYAVIRGSAAGHGGTTSGVTVPSPVGQADVVARAIEDAGVDPSTISYVEAHAAGTSLGDPIEVEGLSRAFRRGTDATQFCALGSVKSNMGHAEGAAGVAALTKTILQLHHRMLVPTLHTEPLNPHLTLETTPFRVQRELQPWTGEPGRPRRAGVSNIGATGSSAHLVLEEFPAAADRPQAAESAGGPFVVPLSAQDPDRLREYAGRLLAFLRTTRQPDAARLLRAELADVLGVDESQVDARADWSEYGVDPVHLATLRDRIEEVAGVELRLGDLVAARRLDGVVEHAWPGEHTAGPALRELAYTFQVGRVPMPERAAFVAHDVDELIAQLSAVVNGDEAVGVYCGNAKADRDVRALLTEDEAYQEVLRGWLAAGAVDKLARAWARGIDVDWAASYGAAALPRRISAPTYPFARQRYWLPTTAGMRRGAPAEREAGSRAASRAAEPERRPAYLVREWRPSPVAAESPSPSDGTRRRVVVLATAQTRDVAWALDRHLPPGYEVIVRDVDALAGLPEPRWEKVDGWIDLVGCGTEAADEYGPWLRELQHFVELGRRDDPRVLCVTTRLESFGGVAVNLAGASRAGLYRALQSEYAHLRSRHVDTDIACAAAEDLARQIGTEYASAGEEPAVCYRDGVRHVPVLREDAVEGTTETPAPFPADHVLLVTGGTRGLGARCARHFVERYGVRTVVLTGREALPPRERWPEYAGRDSVEARRVAAVRAVEEAGATVRVVTTPLADARAVEELVREVVREHGPIGGVLHAAGAGDADNPAFVRKPLDAFRRVAEPKVAGLRVLRACLADQPLRFFVLFSSTASAIPALGAANCDYAAANAYLDFVAAAQPPRTPMVSIQWSSWAESGFGEMTTPIYHATGLGSHSDAEGLRMLDHILAHDLGPVVLPAVPDRRRWRPETLLERRPSSAPAVDGGGEPPRETRVARAVPTADGAPQGTSVAPVQAVRAWLVRTFADELRMDVEQLDADVPFHELGVDSILLAQVLQPINREVSEPIDPSALYEYPTFDDLAAWLTETYGAELVDAVGGAEPRSEAGSGAPFAAAPDAGVPREPDVAPAPPRPIAAPSAEQVPERGTAVEKAWVPGDAIAIVGLSGRFPPGGDLEAYWETLVDGRTAIERIPAGRWEAHPEDHAALLPEVTEWDPDYFGIPLEEAAVMDRQALVLLEECAALVAHAGYSPAELRGGRTGVYVGARGKARAETEPPESIRAVGQNYLAANLSQFLDLHGPSVVVDTACSSALSAVHLAVQALRSGEIESAIVGSVSLLTSAAAHNGMRKRGILSAAPEFHVFDRRADGVVLGDACGLVLLKTVDAALRDGDRVHAVLRGIAVNNNGRTAGPTAPNFDALKSVLRAALASSGLSAADVDHVETNGSGSTVTDLLELKAIQEVYRGSSDRPCTLGSIKPNIGHPLCAEGMSALLKTVLMVSRGTCVPCLSGHEPLEHFDVESSPLWFPREVVRWDSARPVAAVNCFADGGANAAAVVQAWDPSDHPEPRRSPLPPPVLHRRSLPRATSGDVDGTVGAGQREAAGTGDGPTTSRAGSRPSIWERYEPVPARPGGHADATFWERF